jgi:hypothetical protein
MSMFSPFFHRQVSAFLHHHLFWVWVSIVVGKRTRFSWQGNGCAMPGDVDG